MFLTSITQAYVSTDAVGNSSTLHQSGGGLVKIPYRIFVGGIAFNVSISALLRNQVKCFLTDVKRSGNFAVTTVEVSSTFSQLTADLVSQLKLLFMVCYLDYERRTQRIFQQIWGCSRHQNNQGPGRVK